MVNVTIGDTHPIAEISSIPISLREISQLVTSFCVQSFLKGIMMLR